MRDPGPHHQRHSLLHFTAPRARLKSAILWPAATARRSSAAAAARRWNPPTNWGSA